MFRWQAYYHISAKDKSVQRFCSSFGISLVYLCVSNSCFAHFFVCAQRAPTFNALIWTLIRYALSCQTFSPVSFLCFFLLLASETFAVSAEMLPNPLNEAQMFRFLFAFSWSDGAKQRKLIPKMSVSLENRMKCSNLKGNNWNFVLPSSPVYS